MPHFFFDLFTSKHFERDAEGLPFDSLEAAYLSASQAAVDISIDMLRERKDPSGYRFEVRDSDGQVVLELPFSEVLRAGRTAKPPALPGQAKLQASLEQNRKLKADLAKLLASARQGALEGLALADVRWDADGPKV